MQNTGIVRRIDDLGRVVIPRELRQKLNIEEGEPLEIFIDNDNNIILKKYQPTIEEVKVALEEMPLNEVLDEYAPNLTLVRQAAMEYIGEWDNIAKKDKREN